MSDQCTIKTVLSIPKPDIVTKHVLYRKVNDIDIAAFGQDLSDMVDTALDINDLNDLVGFYDMEMAKIFDKHAPQKTRTVVCRSKLPWFGSELRGNKKIAIALQKKCLDLRTASIYFKDNFSTI